MANFFSAQIISFAIKIFLVTLLNNASFLQFVLENSQSKAHFSYAGSVPTAFEPQLYSHAGVSMSREFERKKQTIVQNATNSTMAGMTV